MSLFDSPTPSLFSTGPRPLADRMRPRTLEELVGQHHLLAPGKPLRIQIERDELSSLILWGPPGVGKTTLAQIIARQTQRRFVPFSAVTGGIREIREVMAEAERNWQQGQRTILFVDEIHRFNKAQQDAFLPYVEKGAITLIGATTENPSFEVNSALLSRSRVYVLEALGEEQMTEVLRRAAQDAERGVMAGRGTPDLLDLPDELLRRVATFANGDARSACNVLEAVVTGTSVSDDGRIHITVERLEEALQHKTLLYDRAGEEHYNLISALHKSLRNSDVDASLYWLVRMLESGEDPLYLARRLVRFASEDVGLADPRALELTLAARDAFHFLGMPEGGLALAQACVYLALAPKSNALYAAYGAVLEDVRRTIAQPVPLHLRNAPTGLMKNLGYSRGYQYAHDLDTRVADMECLPENLRERSYFRPSEEGVEKRIRERMQDIRRRRAGTQAPGSE